MTDWKKTGIKEIESTTAIIDKSIEHEREPEDDIRSTNFTKIRDHNEGIKIHINYCQYNVEPLEELDNSRSQDCIKTSTKRINLNYFAVNKNSVPEAKVEIWSHISHKQYISTEQQDQLRKLHPTNYNRKAIYFYAAALEFILDEVNQNMPQRGNICISNSSNLRLKKSNLTDMKIHLGKEKIETKNEPIRRELSVIVEVTSWTYISTRKCRRVKRKKKQN